MYGAVIGATPIGDRYAMRRGQPPTAAPRCELVPGADIMAGPTVSRVSAPRSWRV